MSQSGGTALKLVAKTFYGLETVLAKELAALGAQEITTLKRAVSFEADMALLYKSNLHLRTAIRILMPIATFNATSDIELYKKIKEMDWSKYLRADQTMAVDAITYSKIFTHSKYVSLKTKDAICDRFRDETGQRPSVDIESPTVLINIHIAEDQVTVSLDSSAEPLNRRGYRTNEHEAPINEVLAAGMVLLSEWDTKSTFIDPMCGSGTIVMEAAMIAANIAPNIKRKDFGFTRWNNFDAPLWEKIRHEAIEAQTTPTARICGSDISLRAIDTARQSALDFGLKQFIDFSCAPLEEVNPTSKKGVVIMNPPYGERLKTRDIVQMYIGIGNHLKRNFQGFDAWVISSNLEAMKLIGLKPSAKITLYNGALECRFEKFSLYEGSHADMVRKRRIIPRDDSAPRQKI